MGWLVSCNRKTRIQHVSDGFVGTVNDISKQRDNEWANFLANAEGPLNFEFKLLDADGVEHVVTGMWQLTDAGALSV